jgi:murein L,D-transpeptidase YcbB/YkuD
LVNLERSRWLPVTVSGEYLVVNIPEFRLHVFQDDSVLWNCDVVVGATAHKTAVFSGTLKYVVFSPYWNVPPGILKNEILPGIRGNPNFLVRHHMEWYNGQVRQKPGPNNSLGLVKFLFPNSHNIYLHDTPSKSLFGETKRAFSHGCIRVSEAKRLAMHLQRTDTSWNEQKISEAMHGGKEIYVTLPAPVQVYITYFTAWVDRSGQLNFRDDVYKRDERLYSMISDKK